jgi:3-methyl-2-oxobutanoate hydroxymethyltransferase
MGEKRVTAPSLRAMKERGETIAMLTAYDYRTARLMDESGVDVILVGDSVANAVMGLPDTLSVTMDHMLHHVTMVSRGADRVLVVADMPFMSYQLSPEQAAANAGRFVKESGAHAVKLEGGAAMFGDQITAILKCGIPVMGHLGLTPQSVHQIGGYKVQGRGEEGASELVEQAKGLEAAGVFSIVLECVPIDAAKRVTESVNVPTIGIGAGPHCDGQVLVSTDMLGLTWERKTRFFKEYADLRTTMKDAFRQYVGDVREGRFPTEEHGFE